jgi:hypothetical protein
MGTIIIPEALVALSTQQPSVLALVSGLSDLVRLAGRPLSELCKEQEVNLRFYTLGLPVRLIFTSAALILLNYVLCIATSSKYTTDMCIT